MFMKLKSNHKAFTIYESVLALMVTILTLGVLQQSLLILKQVQNTSFREQLRWHITQEKLQSILQNNKIVKLTNSKIIYEDRTNNNQKMVIESYPDKANSKPKEQLYMLRLTTAAQGGHEPIIMNLRKITIEKIRNLVIITTVNNNAGKTSEICLTNEIQTAKN
ncbi:competence type IV pilus minor pilin ComGF [Companilactobacillus mindensis]|nr:competence type IV pilus minor pilin ComGF [Companilactobacillus mindensis]GEO78486.1 hypothetical protein LMI01_08170 [Companilactobacillus mindensis]